MDLRIIAIIVAIIIVCPPIMLKDRLENYKKIESERNSKLLVFITGDKQNIETQIGADTHDYFVNHLDKFNLPQKITLFLYTRGGDTMAAWGIINLIRQFCDEYEVIIPSKARSAGTLISLGAAKIMMTKQATLGPIDPSLNSPLNPQNPSFPLNPQARVPVSVESIKGYFEYAKELGIKNEKELASAFIDLSQKIHPIVIGSVFRSRAQIHLLANKLLTQHFPEGNEKKIKDIISFLCSESGSHDYPIYRREARNLGLNIEKPSDEFYLTIKSVMQDISAELDLATPYNPNIIIGNNPTASYSIRRALIESIDGGTDVFISKGILSKKQTAINIGMGAPIMQTTIEDQRNEEGWYHENI
jgi:hypothetical protein